MGLRKPSLSDAFWDIEALKLQLIKPEQFEAYRSGSKDKNRFRGRAGLALLNIRHDNSNVNIFGRELIAACKRAHKP